MDREESILDISDRIKREIELNEVEAYHDGAVAAFNSLKGAFLRCNKEYIKVRELIDEIIPGCIKIADEENEKVRKIIENKNYDDDYIKGKVIPN